MASGGPAKSTVASVTFQLLTRYTSANTRNNQLVIKKAKKIRNNQNDWNTLINSFLTLASRIFSSAKRIFSALRRAASAAAEASALATGSAEALDADDVPELLEAAPDDAELSLDSMEMLSEKAESLSGLSVRIPESGTALPLPLPLPASGARSMRSLLMAPQLLRICSDLGALPLAKANPERNQSEVDLIQMAIQL